MAASENDDKISATIATMKNQYDVEHLATFSTASQEQLEPNETNNSNNGDVTLKQTATTSSATKPKEALQKLFELEKQSGIWTQRMQIGFQDDVMLIIDCETNTIVERFNRGQVTNPEAFSHYNNIYNNIIVFIIDQRQIKQREKPSSDNNEEDDIQGELHIFQCVSHKAKELVSEILDWKNAQTSSKEQDESTKKSTVSSGPNENHISSSKPVVTVESSSKANDSKPIVNVNVKETVQVFNQIAALREKKHIPTCPSQTGMNSQQQVSSDPSNAPIAGQFYKQRSIRATLAPNLSSTQQEISRANQNQQSIASSSTSSTKPSESSSIDNNKSTASSQSASNQQKNLHHNDSSRVMNEQLLTKSSTSSASSSSSSATAARASISLKHDDFNAKVRQPTSKKNVPGPHQAHSSNNHTQSSISCNHNHQQQPSGSSDFYQQVTTNESYVSVLNHCFDDIEKFIMRIQQAYAAMKELQAKKRQSKRSAALAMASQANKSHPHGPLLPLPPPSTVSELAMLDAQARGPSADDFFEILSKFKLAFNLLAKLKGCIHEPNAPELVHFLFTPLAIIIESARNVTPPVDPTVVGIPYLNGDALDLLSNCCTSKESDLWLSLGPNWTETIDVELLKASRLPSSFQPIFSDGWAPVINELELIGLSSSSILTEKDHYRSNGNRLAAKQPIIDDSAMVSTCVDAVCREQDNRGISGFPKNKQTRKPASSHDERYLHQKQHPREFTGVGFSREPDMVDDSLALINVNYPSDPYRVSELPSNNHHHRSSRHSRLPPNERSSRSHSKHLSSNSRRASGYMEFTSNYGLETSNDITNNQEEHLDSKYSSYPSYATNSYDNYTKIQGADYLAGPSISHRDEYQSQYGSSQMKNGQSKRKSSKNASFGDRLYLAKPRHVNDDLDMLNEATREAMLMDIGPAQTEWFYELKLRGALTVRVLFTRAANNDKELSVKRGEILEILDDSRKWWKARNIDLQVAYVPHTIVVVMDHYQTLDDLLTGGPVDMMMVSDDPASIVNSQRYSQRASQIGGDGNFHNQNLNSRDERHSSKTAKGAFKYF